MGILLDLTEETWLPNTTLRVSSIYDAEVSDNIKGSYYALDDFELDPPIFRIIKELYMVKPLGWRDRLVAFAAILESGWAKYENKVNKVLRYAKLYSSDIQRKRVGAHTNFAKLLRNEPWLPTLDDFNTPRRPSDTVLDTEENRNLSDKQTPLSSWPFKEQRLISFLNIKEHPPESTPFLRLHYAVARQEDDLNTFKHLYDDLNNDADIQKNDLRAAFRDQALIFVPDHDPSYVTSQETLYAGRTSLGPRMAAIKNVYPNLEEFFTESLGIPKTERLEHFVEFLPRLRLEISSTQHRQSPDSS